MAKYKPSGPFVVPFHILSPSKSQAKGVGVKSYVDSGVTFFGAFRTFGGTENVTDGVYVVKNTAALETWYTPELTAASRIVLQDTGEVFEVRGTPEDIERRHQYMIAKLEGVRGDG